MTKHQSTRKNDFSKLFILYVTKKHFSFFTFEASENSERKTIGELLKIYPKGTPQKGTFGIGIRKN
jgi:hypothetical protein